MHTIQESIYTVIKLPRSGNSLRENNYQAQITGGMHLMIFTQIIHL